MRLDNTTDQPPHTCRVGVAAERSATSQRLSEEITVCQKKLSKTISETRSRSLNNSVRGQEETVRTPHKGTLSPFRYPGGKGWFLKIARSWLRSQLTRPRVLVEAFAGGAGISLAAVNEGLVRQSTFAERDRDVAATWEVMLNGEAQWLIRKITSFKINRRRVERALARKPRAKRHRAFRCLLHNRTSRGGVIAKGAGLIRKGEDGNGISSRWYPKKLADRIRAISALKPRFKFSGGDGFKLIRKHLRNKGSVFFIDPPYTKAARRLYKHWEIDHEKLFHLLSRAKGDILMTYDDTREIRELATRYGFQVRRISMRTSHHQRKRELMISRDFNWRRQPRRRRRPELR